MPIGAIFDIATAFSMHNAMRPERASCLQEIYIHQWSFLLQPLRIVQVTYRRNYYPSESFAQRLPYSKSLLILLPPSDGT